MKQILFVLAAGFLFAVQSAPAGDQTPLWAPKTGGQPAASTNSLSGKVLETTNTAGYTYVLVDTGAKKLWAAAPVFETKVGDSVVIGDAMPMPNYHSKTLNRDFDVVYFTGSVTVNGAQRAAATPAPGLPPNHPAIPRPAAAPALDVSGVKKAEGGKTIAEIFAAQAKLGGQPVKVRGKVVKYNAMIMGKNWLHLRDGTGSAGSNDLTVTTAAEAKVGDTVLVTGTLSLNKDFGAGYKYSVIVEDAKVTVE